MTTTDTIDPETLLTPEYRLSEEEAGKAFIDGHVERARGGDGYDVMEKAESAPRDRRWHAIASWGSEGWDLGDWPYVVIYGRRGEGESMDMAYYCEGDVTVYRHATRAEHNRAIDGLAFFHWKNQGYPWVEGIEHARDMPPKLCGPYSSERSA